jgi:hypothetical protein
MSTTYWSNVSTATVETPKLTESFVQGVQEGRPQEMSEELAVADLVYKVVCYVREQSAGGLAKITREIKEEVFFDMVGALDYATTWLSGGHVGHGASIEVVAP